LKVIDDSIIFDMQSSQHETKIKKPSRPCGGREK
jgi:hypothetical protein